ncbi:MAG: fused MFS/spermidine synthase, partial [Actinomycetota bacterium]|nr:fused MFS/spermidine synthase [Actinomycetota bacterium]
MADDREPAASSTALTDEGAKPASSQSTFALLLLCFFLSGLAALIYQTAWTRTFAFVFGTSELAVATVLAAYMAGLAVGATVAARLVERVRRPVLVYGVLEGAIAVSALCVPLALRGADALHVALFAVPDAPPAAGHAVNALFYLVAAFAVLIVPTALMGATLPLLAREAIHRQRDVGPRIAVLYAMNTAGAVAGTLLAGFWLLPALGLSGTVWIAVAANAAVFVAAASVGLRSRPGRDSDAATRIEAPAFVNGWVLPVMLASGAVSFTYEVLWTRLLGHVLGGSVYAFATMLASFLTGIALGSAAASRFSRDAFTAGRALFVCQLGIGLLSLAAFLAMDSLPGFTRALGSGGAGRLAADAISSVAVLLPSTTLLGATFPLAVRLYARDETGAPTASARVYAWNTVGAIVGALGAGFFLIPAVGFARAVALAAAANLFLAAAVALRAPGRAGAVRRKPTGRVLAAMLPAAIVLLVPPPTPWTLLRTAPLGLNTSPGELVFDVVGR